MKTPHARVAVSLDWRPVNGEARSAALYWWRQGRGAAGLRVIAPGGDKLTPSQVDWKDAPDSPPKGHDAPPRRGRSTVATMLRLSPGARDALEQKSTAAGLNFVDFIEQLLLAEEP
jgi:hypothetical protein